MSTRLRASQEILDFIKSFESYRDKAYDDGCGKITIGWGTTRYPNRYKVQDGDKCTPKEAETWFMHGINTAENVVNNLLGIKHLSQNQFDALVSFEYNSGGLTYIDKKTKKLVHSMLLQKALIDPNDQSIYRYNAAKPVDSCELLRWVRGTVDGKKKVLNGLVTRRKAEADLYGKK